MDDLKNKKLLIIDDERDIREMVDRFLRKEGYNRIHHAASCREAVEICRTVKPDLVILDVMLPDGDGFSLLPVLRRISDMPILFLSAKGEDEDRLLGLGLGADDYIVKPFLPRELLLRMGAILRRVYAPIVKEERPVFQLGSRRIDLESGIVEAADKSEQPLTAKELILLHTLYESKGRIVTSDALCQAAWGNDYFGSENTLMVHVRRIREKIEENPSQPQFLLNVRGLGYKLMAGEG